jgi:hypothetical protein
MQTVFGKDWGIEELNRIQFRDAKMHHIFLHIQEGKHNQGNEVISNMPKDLKTFLCISSQEKLNSGRYFVRENADIFREIHN